MFLKFCINEAFLRLCKLNTSGSSGVRLVIIGLFLSSYFTPVSSQTYELNKSRDIALGSGIVALGLLDIKLQYDLSVLTESDISNLQSDQVFSVDRFATDLRSLSADRWSDNTHYASTALPLFLLATDHTKSDLLIIGIMLVESIGLNTSLTMLTKNLFKRERPFTYNSTVSLSDKQVRSARQSFISGHASNSATLGFFTAKVFSDLHPESKWKPVVWAVCAGLPAAVSGLRVGAGKHFLTDVLAGYALGGFIGYIIPETHKRNNSSRVRIGMTMNGMVSLSLTLNQKNQSN